MAEVNEAAPRFDGARLILIAGSVGVLGLGSSVVGLFIDPRRTYFSYLTAFAFCVSIALGALLFLMVGYATKLSWPIVFRRITESVAGTLPLLALLWIPILLGARFLYPWVHPSPHLPAHTLKLLAWKRPFLRLGTFVIRAGFYFLLWGGAAILLRRWSFQRDRRPTKQDTIAERFIGGAGIPVTGLALNFAAFDWLMSLQPTWVSTMFGVDFFAAAGFGAMATLVVLCAAAEKAGYLDGKLNESHYHGLGRLMFVFVVFWTYIGFFQYMIIYIGNIPEDVTFYLHRSVGSWEVISYELIFGHFVIPFFALLSKKLKFRRAPMVAIGGWLLFMHYVDMYWLVIPVVDTHGVDVYWTDGTTLVGVVGVCIAYAAWRLRGRFIVPINDPRYQESLLYKSQ